MQTWGYSVNAIAAAAVIACVVTIRPRVLTHPVLVRIGVLSYGIYLWHNAAKKGLDPWIGDAPLGPRVVVMALLTGAAVVLSYELVEQRFRRSRPDLGDRHVDASRAGAEDRRDDVRGLNGAVLELERPRGGAVHGVEPA
jgi:peptidoglycan/LPS O-acetylase OafA/YrhL